MLFIAGGVVERVWSRVENAVYFFPSFPAISNRARYAIKPWLELFCISRAQRCPGGACSIFAWLNEIGLSLAEWSGTVRFCATAHVVSNHSRAISFMIFSSKAGAAARSD